MYWLSLLGMANPDLSDRHRRFYVPEQLAGISLNRIASLAMRCSSPWQAVFNEKTMIRDQQSIRAWIVARILLCFYIGYTSSSAQDISPGQIIAAFADEQVRNKAALGEYIWQQQEIISIKDRLESQRLFQVEIGRDGRTEKMPLDLPEETSSSLKTGRGMAAWAVQKKKHSVQQYAGELQKLAETYVEASPDLLRAAYDRRDISIKPAARGFTQMFIHNYLKPDDTATLTFDEKTNELQSIDATSYVTSSKELVEIHASFSNIQNGPDHIDEIRALDPKRKLSVLIRHLEYRRR